MKKLTIIAIPFLAPIVGLAQPALPRPTFEVASVKACPGEIDSGSNPRGAQHIHVEQGGVTANCVSLNEVLRMAYHIPSVQNADIVAPSWLDSNRYDIAARLPKDTPGEQIPAMLENLLAERFRMTVHWSSKRSKGYALVPGKSGLKLKPSRIEDGRRKSGGMTAMFTSTGHLTWKAATIDRFVNSLAFFLGRPVVNMTGIQREFDIVLDVAPDSLPGINSSSAPDPEPTPRPSIFTAIQDLGLSLESRDVDVKQLVVDSAQKIPTEN